MSDFSDRPFVAGSLVGLRTFRVDPLGRLTGVTHKDVWTPGENEAVCHALNAVKINAGTFTFSTQMIASLVAHTDAGQQFPNRGKKSKKQPVPPVLSPEEKARSLRHEVAAKRCDCGFYAYFDGANDYLIQPSSGYSAGGYVTFGYAEPDRAPRIAAIVEGYGVCTVGTRGFRASKARILAIVDPGGETAKTAVAFDKVRRNYPDVLVFDTEREAVTTFPLTDPFDASPADDDFWTRSAT